MLNDTTIIVGHDGTARSGVAVQWAADEAEARHAKLRIVCCFEYPLLAGESMTGWGMSEAIQAAREGTDRNMAAIRTVVIAEHPELAVSAEVSAGPASSVLLEGTGSADLVVVGQSTHDGAAAFWLGTTARYLVHHSPCPVVVVRGMATSGRPDRIVVGTDGSSVSDDAIRWAGDEADRHGVPLVIVHGWTYPYLPTDVGSIQARELTEIDAACTLDRAAQAARERYGALVTTVLVEAGAVTALLETARDGDLVVVGSRGQGALRSRLFGSTAYRVLDLAAVPVVVVPPALRAQPTSARSMSAASFSGLVVEP